jgi:hypothetical protein
MALDEGDDMARTTTTRIRPRELAHRAADGIEVTLFWSATENLVTLEVYDSGSEEIFEIEVPSDRALDAFHHPFAYAAHRDVEYRLPVLKVA